MVDKQPFVTFLTRACCRPQMLQKCIDSVLAQTVKDWEQVFILDTRRRGLVWANNALANNRDRVWGQWVFHLDDDCRLIMPSFIARVQAHLKRYPDSEVIMLKSKRQQFKPHILPHASAWGKPQNLNMRANGMCHIVRRDVWYDCIPAICGGGAGANRFIQAFLKAGAKLSWLDIIASETQQVGSGVKFEECKANWWTQITKQYKIKQIALQDWRLQP